MGECQSCFKNENEIIIETEKYPEEKIAEGIYF